MDASLNDEGHDVGLRSRRIAFHTVLGALAVIGAASSSRSQTAVSDDLAVMNLLLSMEYLQAQFYSYVATGGGVSSDLLGGSGQRGEATGGRKALLTDPLVVRFASEVASDQSAHLRLLRTALGADAVAQPRIDLGTGAGSAFDALGIAAELSAAGSPFDPYLNDRAFMLAAYFLEDLGVTAYREAAGRLRDAALVDLVVGILGTEAHHAAVVRTMLHAMGAVDATLLMATDRISMVRTRLNRAIESDKGVTPVGVAVPGTTASQTAIVANVVPPLGGSGLVGRAGPQILNVLYMSATAASSGGFFPIGVNGSIRTASTL